MPTIVKCNQCEADAVVTKIVGLLEADDPLSGIRVMHIIDCPNCGVREQPRTPPYPHKPLST